MSKTDTPKKYATSIVLTAGDRRNIQRIIRQGYVASISGAIRYALAVVAKGGDR